MAWLWPNREIFDANKDCPRQRSIRYRDTKPARPGLHETGHVGGHSVFGKMLSAFVILTAVPTIAAPADPVIPAPSAAQWSALAQLPDWSGVWLPDIRDQDKQVESNPVPWKPEVQKQVDFWTHEEDTGRPRGLLVNCLPHGMPSLMLITHNATEFLFTPGRVTMLGESDGNRLRRIWTDGRAMPADPDPGFNGYSVGEWQGDTLVVETRGILPQVFSRHRRGRRHSDRGRHGHS